MEILGEPKELISYRRIEREVEGIKCDKCYKEIKEKWKYLL